MLAETGVKMSVEVSRKGVLNVGPASSSGRGEKVTGTSSPVVDRSREVLFSSWLVSTSTLCALPDECVNGVDVVSIVPLVIG